MDAAVHQRDPEVPTPPKRTKSWEAKNAIIYDASTQTLTKDDRSSVKRGTGSPSQIRQLQTSSQAQKEKETNGRTDAHTQVSIPKRARGLQDQVQLSLSYDSPSIDTFLANLRLDRLGFEVALQRLRGNIDEIWVTGVPRACSVIVAR